jgi:hypothetical protein
MSGCGKKGRQDNRGKGISQLAPKSGVPWIHHNCPRRNMLALFNNLKKSDASAVVNPVISWLFLPG